METRKRVVGRRCTNAVMPGLHPDSLGNKIHVHLWMRNDRQGTEGRVGPWLPRRQRGGVARHETDEVGCPLVGGKENSVERHHFLHGEGAVAGSCVTIGRIEEDARKVCERGVELRVDRLQAGRGRVEGESGTRLVAIVLERSLLLYRGSLRRGVEGVSSIEWPSLPKVGRDAKGEVNCYVQTYLSRRSGSTNSFLRTFTAAEV